MTYEEAVIKVESYLVNEANELNAFGSALPDYENPGIKLQVIHRLTETHEFGWVFFYNSEKYIETEDFRYALAGNAPLIVDKHSEEVIVTGTAKETSHYIKSYILTGDPHGNI